VRIRGTITKWNEKGFGFITPADGGKQVFVHARAFSGTNQRPAAGMKVTYEVAHDPEGRLSAENAAIAGIRLMPGPASRAFIVGVVFLSLVGYAATRGSLPGFLFWLFLGTSVLAFGLYKLDKSAARSEGQRTPENTLLSLRCWAAGPAHCMRSNCFGTSRARHHSKWCSGLRLWRMQDC
jgi:cold shock CspA family protein